MAMDGRDEGGMGPPLPGAELACDGTLFDKQGSGLVSPSSKPDMQWRLKYRLLNSTPRKHPIQSPHVGGSVSGAPWNRQNVHQ
uniref:Uncharacterized protein n=1 Tax=Physcomitrium patens TaxID=3218 RepID=A0A2K1KH13_PHYPA|nr:hypothetical protein PHYPA_009445 [Physcomitrium patens]